MAKKAAKKSAKKTVADDLIGEVKPKAAKKATVRRGRPAAEPKANNTPVETAPPVKRLGAGFIRNCPIPAGVEGDKNAKVVEWFRDNDPAEFKRRYHGRRTHLSGDRPHDFSAE